MEELALACADVDPPPSVLLLLWPFCINKGAHTFLLVLAFSGVSMVTCQTLCSVVADG